MKDWLERANPGSASCPEAANLNRAQSVVAIFAHPDDESILAGGALAQYAALGWETTLLCATRGEWGPISDETLASYEDLGRVRECELRAACDVLGVSRLQFLDLEDGSLSTLFGTAEEEKAIEKIVRALREIGPQTVITFGPDGWYGHQDHIAIGRLATEACAVAGDANLFPGHLADGLAAHCVSNLYYASVPCGLYSELVADLACSEPQAHFWGIPAGQFGISRAEITTIADITPFLDRKLAAIRCHRTQLDACHVFTLLTPELAAKHLSREFFRQSFP